jgi:hypothetical protein
LRLGVPPADDARRERPAMKAVIVGAGQGCRAVLELLDQGRLLL